MPALQILTMPDGLLAVRHEPAPAPAISDADRERWALATAEVRELREANPVPVPGWRRNMSDAAVRMPSKVPCDLCDQPASPVTRLCPRHSMRCRNCNAKATDDNPVEADSEECLACHNDRGREYGPMPTIEREF